MHSSKYNSPTNLNDGITQYLQDEQLLLRLLLITKVAVTDSTEGTSDVEGASEFVVNAVVANEFVAKVQVNLLQVNLLLMRMLLVLIQM